jgi:hypothetical protein
LAVHRRRTNRSWSNGTPASEEAHTKLRDRMGIKLIAMALPYVKQR